MTVLRAVCAGRGCRVLVGHGERFCGVHGRGEVLRRRGREGAWVYRSRRWGVTRRLVLERCGGVCEVCGVAAAVSVDHWPVSVGGCVDPFDAAGCRGLCRACHGRVDGGRGAA